MKIRPHPFQLLICITNKKAVLLLCLFFASFTVFSNDYFEELYQQLNANIDVENFEANFRLIEEWEKDSQFKLLDCYAKGRIYHKIGLSHYLAYQEKKAVYYFKEKVLPLWEGCKTVPTTEKANTVYNLGICYQYLGNNEEAKVYLDEALDIFEKDPQYPAYQLALKYHGIALFYEENSDYFRSQLYLSSAIDLFEKENAVLEQFDALNDAVTLQMDFKDYDQASDYADKAFALAQTHSGEIPFQDLAPVYLNAATIYYEQEKFEASRERAEKALQIMDKEGTPQFHAIGLEILAFLHMEKGQFKAAEELMHRVLYKRKQFYKEDGGLSLMALTHENFAELYLRKGDLYKANEQLKKGFAIAMPGASLDKYETPIIKNFSTIDERALIRLLELKTRIFEKRFEQSGDFIYMQRSLNVQHKIDSVINRGLLSFQFEQSKLDFLNTRFEHYGKGLQNALQLYDITNDQFYLEEAFKFSTKTKASILQQELNRVNALRSTVSNDVLVREQELRQRMNEQQDLLLEASDELRDSLSQTFIKSQNALEAFQVEIEKNEPQYFQERYKFLKAPVVKVLQEELPEDMAMVEFFVAQDTVHAFWIGGEAFLNTAAHLDDQLKGSIARFTEQCRNPELTISTKDSQYIYDKLLKEGVNQLKSVERLCIIPDGVLHTVSFEALNDGQDYLIRRFAFSYAYAPALISKDPEDSYEPSYDYLGFGTTYSDQLNPLLRSKKRFFGKETLSKLTLAGKEVEQAAQIFKGKTFQDQKATLENFYTHAEEARIIHLSLHGLVDVDDPNRSCVIFDDSHQNFLLSPTGLYKMRITADLVLLSACHSASGRIYKGEGVQGMSKAFLLAGAQNVLSSLWNASEASSMEMTQNLLKNIDKGLPFDNALRESKLKYLQQAPPSQQHPYYWANFILLGQVDQALKSESFPVPLLMLVSVVVILIVVFFSRKFLKGFSLSPPGTALLPENKKSSLK
ncbi:CHAT domain-containing protein [Poritiphilus flavus]|uniref:CHAT domain-containing protein n=1 Tax=Poritiphilus flavus TaxID=2697053 RepID=A0A6L9EAT6_9FLAO|nr:CHAT domain-containing protein [Poritiphilus flavus]NAS11856.1 CHAT domain-containing protein [Poritiphilus flavus]